MRPFCLSYTFGEFTMFADIALQAHSTIFVQEPLNTAQIPSGMARPDNQPWWSVRFMETAHESKAGESL